MEAGNEIVNRVATSALKIFDLEEFYVPGERVLLDIRDQLFKGMILREKSFRDFIRSHDWAQYKGKMVAVTCSEDTIIPTWAYMLLATSLEPYAHTVAFGGLEALETKIFFDQLAKVDWSEYQDAKVVVKGCSKVPVPVSAYVEVTARLRPYVSSLMFGEPCSTVPVYKRPRNS
jgi:hypothetical protein